MKQFEEVILSEAKDLKQFCFVLLMIMFHTIVQAGQGSVDILVSDSGLPKPNQWVRISDKILTTDEVGFATLDLEEGTHQLELKNQEGDVQKVPFSVVAGERTQLLVNLFGEQVATDLSEPVKKEIRTLDESVETGDVVLVVKSVNGSPVNGVNVFAKGVVINRKTDRSGKVKLKLPTGSQTLSLTHPKFSTQVVRDVQVPKDGLIEKRVELTPAGLVLEDFVVLAPNMSGSIAALIEVRRKASDVADVMSAEQMAKTGDSDAAGSLKRVTGLTLKDGKYVYVRGLGERYSSTLLNGVALPSPDPSRRVVPLDLFPVTFLDSMVIQKSFSPNQPGEFGGGVVMLKTKSMPEKFYAKVSLSQSQNTNDGQLLTYQGGSTDWMGVDDGGRKLPNYVYNADANLNQLVEDLPSRFEEQDNLGLPNLSLSFGDRFGSKNFKVGYNIAGMYKDSVNYREEERFRYVEGNGGELQQEEDFFRRRTQLERVVGGIAGIHFNLFKHHDLKANLINLRNTTDYVAVMDGVAEDGPTRQNEVEWAARTLKTLMVEGESEVPAANDLKVRWYAAESNARRDEPRRMTSIYSPGDSGEYEFAVDDGVRLRYYDLQEVSTDFGAQMGMPFPWFGKRKGQVDVGFSETFKDRNSQMARFIGEQTTSRCAADLTQDVATIYQQCPDSFNVRNATNATDNYQANQNLRAYFFKTKVPLLASIDVNTGMRFEESRQQVETTPPFETNGISSILTTRDWLPSAALTWRMNKKMQVRLAYSETVSRPDLRELSNTVWEDFDTGFNVQGNPNLNASVISAYDARWEWYFTQKENLSFGMFYKDFVNPIEAEFIQASDPTISFFNVPGAVVYGAEVEVSKNLGFLTSWLRRFSLSGNYAFILSDVEIGDIAVSAQQETSRPLQGQSNYTANFLLDYEHEPYRLNASLAYNVYGKRLAYKGEEGLPHIYELPFHQLDFVISKRFSNTMKLNAKLRNLLNPEVRFVQGDRDWQRFRRGLAVSVGMSMEI